MPLVDYITMAGTRNTGNPRYKGGSEQFQAINTPWFMDDLCTYLLGYNDVSSINSYNIAKKGKSLYDHLSKSAYYEKIQDLIDSLNLFDKHLIIDWEDIKKITNNFHSNNLL